MVRVYKRKSERQSWNSENMEKAIEAHRKGEMGYGKAAVMFGVPRSTLRDRLKGKTKCITGSAKGFVGFKPVFTAEQEKALESYLLHMEEILMGYSRIDVQYLAFQLAVRNGLEHPFNIEETKAGKDWYYGFMRRHPALSLRTPEATSAARARAFNHVNVNAFFNLLTELIDKFKFTPGQIYNVDETGITTVQGTPSKIIGKRGKKQIGCLSSAERGELVTSVICMSATGTFVPPLLIFPRVRFKPELMDGAPPGSIYACHPSGWMQKDIFSTWFHHFLETTRPTAENPILLILDGHSTHTKNIDVIDLARENHVHMLCLPPHCTHRSTFIINLL